MTKEEIDLEWHLIRFSHGVVVNKQLGLYWLKRSSLLSLPVRYVCWYIGLSADLKLQLFKTDSYSYFSVKSHIVHSH